MVPKTLILVMQTMQICQRFLSASTPIKIIRCQNNRPVFVAITKTKPDDLRIFVKKTNVFFNFVFRELDKS